MSAATLLNKAALAGVLIGDSPAMCETRELIDRLGPTSLSVRIEGPTGVGKELVAQSLHQVSGRRGNLVAVNASAIPDSIFESLLFGHVRGAFTGAMTDHVGHLTEAHSGTLFLDEIGELTLQLQAKLLRVLETRVFRKVGSRHDETSDFRLVVATNANLSKAVADGRFRADLAYRFGAAVIRVPALRERVSDIPVLAAHFAHLAFGQSSRLSNEAVQSLMAYDWPGNVRELRHVIELATQFSDGDCLTADSITAVLRLQSHSSETAVAAPELPERHSAERRALIQCLERNNWHVPSAAREIGVTKKTIYVRIQRLGITIPGRYQRRGPPSTDAIELLVM